MHQAATLSSLLLFSICRHSFFSLPSKYERRRVRRYAEALTVEILGHLRCEIAARSVVIPPHPRDFVDDGSKTNDAGLFRDRRSTAAILIHL
ncbi:hypothetical protein L484_008928 [Morus notabilis]|uniref:Secreted protein n=1 Tax=Morus notabilis TaxID=981085 RepID=W9QE62_9ROSA|nr:hypothetical protein L484_008928 [Morus notabilis]